MEECRALAQRMDDTQKNKTIHGLRETIRTLKRQMWTGDEYQKRQRVSEVVLKRETKTSGKAPESLRTSGVPTVTESISLTCRGLLPSEILAESMCQCKADYFFGSRFREYSFYFIKSGTGCVHIIY